ncbi:pentapeptide repeat-containing protein [Cryobacterium cryoconiti]|uniref:Pentapeptide repeat-containing protein n=1 Tax=Cryobacterium cryoconiti TaxID=1259239 RepID=A0A4Y8JTD0_9MICO|nr:pentapeptide repeat-containing protein [Cryobacterium cryoconiti]TFD29025.1 pentapeptide repeat-containing protein [Cryobacterium cryoconiti]
MARAKTRGPQLDPIVLAGLTDADGSDLRAGDSREAERFTGCDLSGRDLTGIGFQECELRGVSLSDTQLRGASVADCVAGELHASVFSAPRSSWRDVSIEHSRLGSVELYEATLRSVHIDGSKLDFVNLRGATLTDVLLSDCIIEELDLGGATVQRLELRNCRIGTLDVTRATLKDADLRSSDFSAIHGLEGLRGATIDDAQLSLLAPVLAAHLGIIVT